MDWEDWDDCRKLARKMRGARRKTQPLRATQIVERKRYSRKRKHRADWGHDEG